MRRAIAAALLAAAGQASATTWHVRPASGGDYGSENGGSYANAWDGSPNIVWGAGGVQPGDTLCVWDTWRGLADADVGGTSRLLRAKISGSAGLAITIDGDCDGDGVYAVFDGANEVTDGFANVTAASGYASYITFRNFELRNFTSNGVTLYVNAGTDFSQTAYIALDNLNIRNVGANGIQSRGRFITMTDLDIDRTTGDSIQHQGNDISIIRAKLRRMSEGGNAGDGIQIETEADNYYLADIDCEQIYDFKQCIIVNTITSGTAANGVLEDFRAICVPGGTAGACVFVTGDGAQVRRGFIRYGSIGFRVAAAATSANMTVNGVIAMDATTDNFQIPSSGVGANIRILHSFAARAGQYNYNLTLSAATTHSVQNSISLYAGICGIRLTNASQSESFNSIFGSGTHGVCQFANARAPGAGDVFRDPMLVGGLTPTTADDVQPRADSPLCGVGTRILGVDDFTGQQFEVLPPIGPFRCPSAPARVQ